MPLEKAEEPSETRSHDGESLSKSTPPPYTAFPLGRRVFILTIITVAGFFGPLADNFYLPALPELAGDFHVSSTAINATVSVFMVVSAFGVSFERTQLVNLTTVNG